ncbi:family 43 glycosylhydrolase [Bacteroides fragilis]|nr:family 43 glycosylhydrolase [Bacteroides fragilis]KAA4777507.1 family 43 glycosylhydrolase [Bacteroides fragilis]KAA4785319.1 family 43 glycosylhydrolase [Bacteroides fragilis]KAA4788589.1 family 43 glycosylhydrolase [Bacteroides fragilis]
MPSFTRFGGPALALAQDMRQDTYCNPLNIDYTYMIYNSDKDISYRSGADPAVVRFRGEYYMFVTRSNGYWHSKDLLDWDFIAPKDWYPQGSNAPAAHNYKDSVLYVTGDPSGSMSILYSDNPKSGEWKATPAILHNLQDPDLFIDDDGKAYMFWGSSNVYPIRGMELDKNHRFLPKGEVKELFNLDMPRHGWERFGENHSDTVLGGYIEGPWLTKHNGKYYMQYGAPGTEFNVYADGVYVADHPMGPYTYQKHNPVSYKPGGYMNGAGHGSTVQGPGGEYWHFASMALSINVNWERRLCMFPAGFDKDGIMYVDTRFGDYPRYAPAVPGKKGQFRGWMLLSYRKPVTASTAKGEFGPDALTDERTKSFWLAEANDERQWVLIDLEKPARVCAVQVNYHDYRSNLYGRIPGLRHRYVIEGSSDGETWNILVDRRSSYKDTPNDYVELEVPTTARYIRYKNIDVPTPNLAISELRVFGLGFGKAPRSPQKLALDRHTDRRDVTVRWEPVKGAQGYNVLWGIAPDKLYSSWMVYGGNELEMKSLTIDQDYYFAVEAFNENGVSLPSETKYVE